MVPFVISHYQAQDLLQARRQGLDCVQSSPDLALTTVTVQLDKAGVHYPEDLRQQTGIKLRGDSPEKFLNPNMGGEPSAPLSPWERGRGEGSEQNPTQDSHSSVPGSGSIHLDWDEVEAVAQDENGCYRLKEDELEKGQFFLEKIQFFSQDTGRAFSLYPTRAAPTMLISGIPMHRIKDTDPHRDTLEKVRAARPVVGSVLDTATGLGYTAIEAARTALHVTTIELDPGALAVASSNPWSQELFDNPKITQRMGDSYDVVAGLEDGSFTRILHDPPAFALAGDLYSADFYHELHRVLRSGGKLFHYIGDPDSKSGRSMTASVLRRLEQVGFRSLQRAPRAFGVTAVK